MAVGFGDAGAEIIADNIRSTQELDPMMPGKRVHAIFGFCDVRHFTSVTEVQTCSPKNATTVLTTPFFLGDQVLQEEIMEFVNNIARIVHLEVTLHGGFPNKNVGDAFLLVWKLPPRPGDPRGPPPRPGRGAPSQPPSLQEVLDKYGIATEEQLQSKTSQTTASAALGQAGEHTLARCGCAYRLRREGSNPVNRWYARQCSSVADRALASVIVIQASMKRARPLQARLLLCNCTSHNNVLAAVCQSGGSQGPAAWIRGANGFWTARGVGHRGRHWQRVQD